MSEYSQQLLDPRWQRKRLEVLSASDWECACCFGKDVTLHVHHKKYVKGRKPWEYSNDELRVLCANCHKASHGQQETVCAILCESMSPEYLVGVLGGYVLGDFSELSSPATIDLVLQHGSENGQTIGILSSILGTLSRKRLISVCKLLKEIAPDDLNHAQEHALQRVLGSEKAA